MCAVIFRINIFRMSGFGIPRSPLYFLLNSTVSFHIWRLLDSPRTKAPKRSHSPPPCCVIVVFMGSTVIFGGPRSLESICPLAISSRNHSTYPFISFIFIIFFILLQVSDSERIYIKMKSEDIKINKINGYVV